MAFVQKCSTPGCGEPIDIGDVVMGGSFCKGCRRRIRARYDR